MSSLWHLALECSSTGGSVALLEIQSAAAPPRLHSQTVLPADRGSVCTLSPSLEGLLRGARLAVADLKSLSVTAGPGSFTGLRVGLATAKMLALASQKPIVAVDTLAAIAQRFFHHQGQDRSSPVRLVTPINAFRKQVFTASWLIDASGAREQRPSCVVDAEEWLADPWGAETGPQLAADAQQFEELWICGPGLSIYRPQPSPQYRIAPEELWQPLAEDVGRLGWQGYVRGEAVSAAELVPNYIRSSAAEEKRRIADKT